MRHEPRSDILSAANRHRQEDVLSSTLNVKQVVPFLYVTDIDRSLRFYLDGLGFTPQRKWIVDGKIRWCWLELGGAALMLQEYSKNRIPTAKLGEGVSLCFQCQDALALYHDFRSRGINASEPHVGNSLWDTLLTDPDGYHLHFASPTDVPEDTKLSEWQSQRAPSAPNS